jgi:hypothetical protein
MVEAQQIGTLYQKLAKEHDEYRTLLGATLHGNEPASLTERIDRLAFHVIEEIIEMRRTYPHKFWRKSEEDVKVEEMLEEAADIFLMMRSMIAEVCTVAGINEQDFLQCVLDKITKNKGRIQNGY